MSDVKNLEKIKEFLSKDRGLEKGIKKPQTLILYASLLDRYIGLPILYRANIKEIVRKLKSAPLSISTKKRLYCALRKWYLLVGRYDIVVELEKRENRPRYKSSRRAYYLKPWELEKILDSCENLKEQLVVMLVSLCGLRPSILVHIKVVNVKGGVIRIPKNITGNKAGEYFQKDVPKKVRPILDEYLVGRKENEYLFDFYGKGKDERTLAWRVNFFISKILKRAGFSYPPYILRHTFGVIHYNAYKDILATKDAMLQKNVSSTEIYAKVDKDWEKVAKKWLE